MIWSRFFSFLIFSQSRVLGRKWFESGVMADDTSLWARVYIRLVFFSSSFFLSLQQNNRRTAVILKLNLLSSVALLFFF